VALVSSGWNWLFADARLITNTIRRFLFGGRLPAIPLLTFKYAGRLIFGGGLLLISFFLYKSLSVVHLRFTIRQRWPVVLECFSAKFL